MECKLRGENEVFTNWLSQHIYFCDCCWRYKGSECKITVATDKGRGLTPQRLWGLFRFKWLKISMGSDTTEIRARSYTLAESIRTPNKGLISTISILNVTFKCYSEEHCK